MEVTTCRGRKARTCFVCLRHSGLTAVEEKEVQLERNAAGLGQAKPDEQYLIQDGLKESPTEFADGLDI